MIRVPDRRGTGTRLELRTPDPSANPYLALAVMLAAGLDGMRTEADWREPVNTNIWEMSHPRAAPAAHRRPAARPRTRRATSWRRTTCSRAALGEHVTEHFLAAKRAEWREYITQVTAWELDRYLARY